MVIAPASHLPYKVEVIEQKRFVKVEAACDDVLCIFHGHAVRVLDGQVLPEELLVVGHLYDQGHVEDVLQPSWCTVKG